MSHTTKKKEIQKEQNNRKRAVTPMNTGTRDMGYKSNQDRKETAKLQSIRKADDT